MTKIPTLRDVARRAGVSVATASRVLNGKDVVNDETRRRSARRDGRAWLHTEPRRPPAEPRPHADDQRRRVVPDPAPGRRATPGRRRGSRRQRVRPRHLQRRVDREARPVPAQPARCQRTDGLLIMSLPPDAERGRRRSLRPPCQSSSSTSTAGAFAGLPRVAGDDTMAASWPRATSSSSVIGDRLRRRRSRQSVRVHIEPGPLAGRYRASARTERDRAAARVVAPGGAWPLRGAGPRPSDARAGRPADGNLGRERHAGARRHRRGARARLHVPGDLSVDRLRRHRGRGLRRPHDDSPATLRVRPTGRRDAARRDRRAIRAEPPASDLAPELVVRATSSPPKEGRA